MKGLNKEHKRFSLYVLICFFIKTFINSIIYEVFWLRILISIPKKSKVYLVKKEAIKLFKKIDEISPELKNMDKHVLSTYPELKDKKDIPLELRLSQLYYVCSYIEEEQKDHIRTISHLCNTRDYISKIRQHLNFLGTERIHILLIATFLHDFSKFIMDKNFLYDTPSFNKIQRQFIEAHPIISKIIVQYIILKNKSLAYPLKKSINIIMEHHENLDGSGYPIGKKGDKISIEGRILRSIDCLEAMTDPKRTYKKPLSLENAIKELQRNPQIYDHFIVELLDKKLTDINAFQENIIISDDTTIEEREPIISGQLPT